MSDFVPLIALGRAVELYRRVLAGDPAGSALLVVALAAAGLETDAVLRDKATLSEWLSGSTNEVTNAGYARKVLTAANLTVPNPNLGSDWVDLDIPDQVWTGVAAGDGWAKLVVCYRPAAASPDTAIIPMSAHDFLVTPDGTDVVAQIASAGFFRAQ